MADIKWLGQLYTPTRLTTSALITPTAPRKAPSLREPPGQWVLGAVYPRVGYAPTLETVCGARRMTIEEARSRARAALAYISLASDSLSGLENCYTDRLRQFREYWRTAAPLGFELSIQAYRNGTYRFTEGPISKRLTSL